MRLSGRFISFLGYFAFFFLTSAIGELIGGSLTVKHFILDAIFSLIVSLIIIIIKTKFPIRKK